MKHILSLAISALLSFTFSPQQPDVQGITTQSQPSLKLQTISKGNQSYSVFYFEVVSPDQLKLIPNYSAKTSANQLYQDNHCQFLINGGFYSKEHQPIGLVRVENQEISQQEPNQLFNGYLAFDSGQASVGSQDTNLANTLQTGPLLAVNQTPTNLQMKTDKNRRRSFALTTDSGQLILAMITDKNSDLTGPYLVDLPDLVLTFAQAAGYQIESAINLDGGSASAIISSDSSLNELNPIGSALCLTN